MFKGLRRALKYAKLLKKIKKHIKNMDKTKYKELQAIVDTAAGLAPELAADAKELIALVKEELK
jgi:hypothetical protein